MHACNDNIFKLEQHVSVTSLSANKKNNLYLYHTKKINNEKKKTLLKPLLIME